MSKIFEQICQIRRLDDAFLHPSYENLSDPYELYDMEPAVDRIKRAIQTEEKILIYGDYDVDGVTASTVMAESLRLAGVKPERIDIMLPDRFADGYGMSPKLIKRAKDQGVTLVITVDCGSRNHAIIDELNTCQIDTIITDHHETDVTMPAAIATINPHRKDHPTEKLQNLAGVGVAFKLATALVKSSLIPDGQEKWLLDLVLIGTICDNMDLFGENRIFGYFGLKVLAKTRRPGLKELMRKAGVKNLNADSIGFQIGPRLNAAGRLDTAELSLNLLRARSSVESAPLAERLETLNKKRKAEQISAISDIKQRGVADDPVIIETGAWHEGVLGIIAGRLVETYQRPAFVLSEVQGDILKGSARSFGDFNLATALDSVKDLIISGGGHAAAAGVKLKSQNLPAFREQINAYYKSLHLAHQKDYFKVHADLNLADFSELDLGLLDELRSLEPYGAGNEEPIFRLTNLQITAVNRLGVDRNHLRLDVKDQQGKPLKLIAFFAPKSWLNLDPQLDHIAPLVKLVENDFNGIKSVEAHIVDIDFLG